MVPSFGIALQASVRAIKGEEVTVFGRISDGSQSFTTGEVVRVQNAQKKPATVGRILHFCVQKASCTYTNGSAYCSCCTLSERTCMPGNACCTEGICSSSCSSYSYLRAKT